MGRVPLEVMWYVYLLQNKKKDWYTRSTKDLKKRISNHNEGYNKSTKYGIGWELIYCEIGVNKNDARAREKYLKSGMGRRYLKNRLKFFFTQDF